jgi:predicted nucleic acid binding AN1-type Zn finger protein
MTTSEQAESVEALSLRLHAAEAEIETMRAIVRRVAEARMCRDSVTMIESCPHCSLKRGGEFGYSGTHDPKCVVTLARGLGF